MGHLAVKAVEPAGVAPLGVGVASSLTLPWADTLLPVRRSSTLRGTLSRAPMLLHDTQPALIEVCSKYVSKP